jgi:TonB family protein
MMNEPFPAYDYLMPDEANTAIPFVWLLPGAVISALLFYSIGLALSPIQPAHSVHINTPQVLTFELYAPTSSHSRVSSPDPSQALSRQPLVSHSKRNGLTPSDAPSPPLPLEEPSGTMLSEFHSDHEASSSLSTNADSPLSPAEPAFALSSWNKPDHVSQTQKAEKQGAPESSRPSSASLNEGSSTARPTALPTVSPTDPSTLPATLLPDSSLTASITLAPEAASAHPPQGTQLIPSKKQPAPSSSDALENTPIRKEISAPTPEPQWILTHDVPPAYPEWAKRHQIEGSVTLRLTLNNEGHVTSAKVVASHPHNTFDRASLRAARQWRFARTAPDTRSTAFDQITRTVIFNLQESNHN